MVWAGHVMRKEVRFECEGRQKKRQLDCVKDVMSKKGYSLMVVKKVVLA